MLLINKIFLKISIVQFQDACIEYGRQQALCDFSESYDIKDLLLAAKRMNKIKKSLTTAMVDD